MKLVDIFWLWIAGAICLMIFDFVVTFLTDSDLRIRRDNQKTIVLEDVVSRMMPIQWYIGSWATLLCCICVYLGRIPIWKSAKLPSRGFQAFTKIRGVMAKVYIPASAQRSLKEDDPETIYVSKLVIVDFQESEYGLSLGVKSIKRGDEVFYRNIEYTSRTYEPGVSGYPVCISRETALKLL